MSYRVTVKHTDASDGSITGYSFVVQEDDFDSFVDKVRLKFRLSSNKLLLLDSSQVPISGSKHLFDRQQLELRIVNDSDVSDESDDDDAVETKSEPDEEWIADDRFCLYPDLIRTHKGRLKCQEMLHQMATFGATFTAEAGGVLRAPNLAAELRVHPSILPRDLPERFAIADLANRSWIVMLCHGGFFAGAALQAGAVLAHKTLHRYVQRRKQGKRQSNHDSGGNTGGHTTVGSQIRRKQEAEFRLGLQKLLLQWKPHLDAADLVFVHAPGRNRAEIVFEDGPLAPSDSRIRPVPISTGRAILQEALRVAKQLATVEVSSSTKSE